MMLFSDSNGSLTWRETVNVDGNTQGYICEWSHDTRVAIGLVPDLTGNGSSEEAILSVDYKTGTHTVTIKDPQKNPTPVSNIKLTFAKNFAPPKGLAVLADTNGNRFPEIGVLDMDYTAKVPVVRVRDVNNNRTYVRTIKFFTKAGLYTPVSLAVVPDKNKNGAYELTVLAEDKNTGKAYSETRDSKTGALLYSNAF